MPPLTILNIPIHPVTMRETLAQVEAWLGGAQLRQIATANPEFVMRAQEDEEFRVVLTAADLCLPDGVGLVWASRWLGKPFPERVAGSELVYHVAELCATQGSLAFFAGRGRGRRGRGGANPANSLPCPANRRHFRGVARAGGK